jgi:hypothetical protein
MRTLKGLAQITIWASLGLAVLALIAFVVEMAAEAPVLVPGFIIFGLVFLVSRLLALK